MKKSKILTSIAMAAVTAAMSMSVATTAFAASKLSIPSSAKYYNGHAYKVYEDSCTWKEAKKKCEKKGGHLATITSKGENSFVRKLVEKTDVTTCWLGATDEKKEGTWKWVTGEKFKYKGWAEGEPNDEYGSEDYLCLYSILDYEWNDASGDTSGYYVCEWEIGKVQGIEQVSTTSSKIVLSWKDQDLATGYEIYYESSKGKYTKYKSTTNASLTIDGLDAATEYNMRIRSKYKDKNGKTQYTPFTSFSIATKPGKAKNLKVVDTISLSWSKVKGAEKYTIYKYNADSKKWESIATSSKNTYKLGKKFGSAKEQYKVRAYIQTSTGQKIYGDYSNSVKR